MEAILGGIIAIETEEDVVNLGKIYSENEYHVKANRLHNSGKITSQNKLILDLGLFLDNPGLIEVDDVMEISVKENGIINLAKLLIPINKRITAKMIHVKLGNAPLINYAERNKDEVGYEDIKYLGPSIYIEAGKFINNALLYSKNSIRFKLLDKFVNYDIDKKFETAAYDPLFEHDINIKEFAERGIPLKEPDALRLYHDAGERLPGVIYCDEGMSIEAKEIRNFSIIEVKKGLSVKAEKFFSGWGQRERRTEALPHKDNPNRTFYYPYNFYTRQQCYLGIGEDFEATANLFANIVGEITVSGAFKLNSGFMLNYGGVIECQKGGIIESPTVLNLAGKLATNKIEEGYNSIRILTTPPAILNVYSGQLKISAPKIFNEDSHIYAKTGILLNGKDQGSEVNNIDSGEVSYERRIHVTRKTLKYYQRQVIGKVLNGGIVEANLNDKVIMRKSKASLSSAQEIWVQDYEKGKNTGTIHAPNVTISLGKGGFEHGVTDSVFIDDKREKLETIDLSDDIDNQIIRKQLKISKKGEFMFEREESSETIPLVIVAENKEKLKGMRLPFSPKKIETMLIKKLQLLRGTGYLSTKQGILGIAEEMFNSVRKTQQENPEEFPLIRKVCGEKIAVIPEIPSRGTGLYFHLKLLNQSKIPVLVPHLKIPSNLIDENLRSLGGSIIAEGENAKLILETSGFLHICSNIHTDAKAVISAEKGQRVESRTYDAVAITQKTEAEKCGHYFLGLGGAKYRKLDITEWHKIKRMQEPTIISTSDDGEVVFIVPKGQRAEFNGALLEGNFVIDADEGSIIANPIRLDTVIDLGHQRSGFFGLGGSKYGRWSTLLPEFFETVFKSLKYGKIKCRILENNGSKIESLGSLEINAEQYIQNMPAAEYISREETEVHSGTFSSSKSKTKETDFSVSVPKISAKDLLLNVKKEIRLEGILEAESCGISVENLEIMSRVFYKMKTHHSGKTGLFSHSSYDYKGKLAKIVPALLKIDGELMMEIFGRYIEEGVLKSTKKWKGRIEELDIRPLEIHEKVEENAHTSGLSFGIPRKVHIPGEGFRDALKSRGAQSAAHLTQGVQQMYNAMNTISSFGLGTGLPAAFGVGNFGYSESDMNSTTNHNFTFDSMTQAQDFVDLTVGKGHLSGTMKAGKFIRIKSNNPIKITSGYDEVMRKTEQEVAGFNLNAFTGTGSVNYQTNTHKNRHRTVKKPVIEAQNVMLDVPNVEYDNMKEVHESSGHAFSVGFGIGEKNPSISVNYEKENNGEGFGFGMNLNVSSKEAFMKSATEAIKAGASAALVGQIAQQAGFGDFWSSIAGTITSAAVTEAENGMQSHGNVTIIHNGHTTSSELLGINPGALRQEFEEFKNQFMKQRLEEGATAKQAYEGSKEIAEQMGQVKEKVVELKKESQQKIAKVLPQKRVSDDELNNLYATIYDEATSNERLVTFIDEVKQAALRIEKVGREEKAKIAQESKFSTKVKKLLDGWVDRQIRMADVQAREAREEIPFLPGIFDAVAQYNSGELSSSEAAREAIQSVASDAVVMAATWGVFKGGSSLVRKGISKFTRPLMSPANVRKLGLNVIDEKFKVNWKNPNILERGMQYEDLVVPELEKAGTMRLAPNTNTFDAFNRRTGHAVSIKSLDTQTAARLIDPRQIEHTVDSYVRKVQNFKVIPETKAQRFEIKRSDILSSEIRIGVPKETNMEQWLSLQKSAIKAEQQGVKITFGSRITKRMSLQCNEKLLEINGGITCTMIGDLIESAQKKLSHPFDNLTLGDAVKTCLENSRELTVPEWDEKYGTDDKAFCESMAKKIDERDAETIQEYGFKDEKALYKNMMRCSITVYENFEIELSILDHEKLELWRGRDFNIRIRYDSPDEILGATVRYALAKCRGKGSYAKGAEIVSKILFPGGVPDSIEDYLATIDPNYEKWLIK